LKKVIPIILLIGFVISATIILVPTSHSANPENINIVYINRKFSIFRNGVVRIIDNYTIRNDGLDPINFVYIGLDDDFYSKLTFFQGQGPSGNTLDLNLIPDVGNGFKQWILYLSNPLSSGMTRNFTIIMEFVDLLSISTNKRMNVEFSKYPASPYLILKYDVQIYSPSDTTINNPYTGVDGTPPIIAPTEENITAWKNEKLDFYITFTTSTPLQGFVYVIREIDLNQIGYIQVYEKHRVKNIGPIGMDKLSSPKFSIPSNAKNIRIYDNFSVLNFDEKVSGSYNNITISLSPNRYTLGVGESFTYYVEYILPIEDYMTFSGDLVCINIDLLFGNFDSQIYHFVSKLILPKGANIISFTGENVVIENYDGKSVIIYDDYSVTYRESVLVSITYNSIGAYWYILVHPFLISLIIGIIASAYVVIKRAIPITKVEIKRRTEVPSSILREFTILYEQKIGILIEMDKMDADFRKRKLRSREYRKLIKTAEKNLAEIDKSLDELKPEFRSAGGRYKEIVDKLEILEGEKTTIKDSLIRLQTRYKLKQIKPIAYNNIRENYEKRLKKIKSNMEKLVQELRDYIS